MTTLNATRHAVAAVLDSAALDPRIGMVVRGGRKVYYAFVDGYDKPAKEGTLAEIEATLGLKPAPTPTAEKVAASRKQFEVTVTPKEQRWTGQHQSGEYTVIVSAKTRDEAISKAREQYNFENGRPAISGGATYKARVVKE